MIWAEIAAELDIAAWKIAKIVKHRFDPRHSPNRKNRLSPRRQQLAGGEASEHSRSKEEPT